MKIKKWVIKKNIKFEVCKNYLEATWIYNKLNQLEKNNVHVESLKESHREFIKNNKLILKLQQRFRNEKHDVFTEDVNKILLSSIGDK